MYQPRPIRFLRAAEFDDWWLKVYGISASGPEPPARLVDAALAQVPGLLPDDPSKHGWVIAHAAADFNFVLIDWIAGENEIHQRIFSGPLEDPDHLEPLGTPAVGCVWEIAVTDFERRAWLRHVLANPDGPDLDRYREEHLNTDV